MQPSSSVNTQITLNPLGGMANRMRSIAAGISLAQHYNARLEIIWFKDTGLNCAFGQLFKPITQTNICLKEASTADKWIYDRPRLGNLYIPRLFQQALFDGRLLDAQQQKAFSDQNFDFEQWMQTHRHTYIASCYPFYPTNPTLYERLFIPVETIEEQIQTYTAQFSPHTIGVHIRRTDNVMAIAQSPLELFLQRMKQETDTHSDCKFFVASDSEEDKATLKKQFGDRIITSSQPADRNSLQGMQEAAVDFFSLSRTTAILGSCYSSFSEIAALIHQIPYYCIQK